MTTQLSHLHLRTVQVLRGRSCSACFRGPKQSPCAMRLLRREDRPPRKDMAEQLQNNNEIESQDTTSL